MKKWSERLWDAWCVLSIVGIWPRFIEPNLLSITELALPISDLPKELIGLKILQFSDLHWSKAFSPALLKKLAKKINETRPDLIVFTGDFLCRSKLENEEGLIEFLNALKASIGCFAVMGNHDYEQFVTLNADGDYDVELSSSSSDIHKGFKRLFSSCRLSKQTTAQAKSLGLHQQLVELLQRTPFKLLHNETVMVPVKTSYLNLCGLGEYMLGRAHVDEAFKQYQSSYPGLILAHNPDSVPLLLAYPGDLILSGHTHGGQVNLPGMWKKFTCMENPAFKSGLKKQRNKWIYINRGVGSVMKFRWFARPELTLIVLKKVENPS